MSEATPSSFSRSLPRRAIGLLSGVAIGIAASALIGLVIVQGWQVIARYVLNDSPSWTEPVTLLLLSTAMSLGAAAGVHTRRHFSFHLFADAAGPAAQRLLQMVPAVVIAAIGATLAYWGWILLLDGWDIPTAGAGIPQSINYLPLSIGGLLMVLFALEQLFDALAGAGASTEGAR
jgi:TRAP-type C4-dicarboxylate transport system permease small subunit